MINKKYVKTFFLALVLFLGGGISYGNWQAENSPFVNERSLQNLRYLQEHSPHLHTTICAQLEKIERHFQTCQEHNIKSLRAIPQKIHFIWIGPKAYPEKLFSNIASWHTHHPEAEIFLWVDRPRPTPLSYVNVVSIDTLTIGLDKEFKESKTFSEKTDILRYEILDQWGGVYSDVDVECHKALNPWLNNYEFFIGMEDIWPMVNFQYLKVCNCVVGARAGHPILQKTLQFIHKHWEERTQLIKKMSMDWQPNHYLTLVMAFQRTFLPISEVLFSTPLGPKDIILPSSYFGLTATAEKGIFCTHAFEGNWKPPISEAVVSGSLPLSRSEELQSVKERLRKVYKNSHKALTLTYVNFFLLLGITLLLMWRIFRKKKEA